MSTKSDILEALHTRVESITLANGYTTNVAKVYSNRIPMGIEVPEHELPAIFIIDKPDLLGTQQSILLGNWEVGLQLWDIGSKSDSDMMQYVRDVFKALYANSATAQVNDAFRLTPSVVELIPVSIYPDLNMIEANRIYEVSFSIRYRTKLFNL